MPMLCGLFGNERKCWARLVTYRQDHKEWMERPLGGGMEVEKERKKERKKKTRVIKRVEEDENNAPDALPRERGTEIYIELRGLNTGSKRISHTVTGPEALRSQCRLS